MYEAFSAENSIIIFDIHGVLFTKNYRLLVRRLLDSQHFWLLARHALKPALWYNCVQLWYRSAPIIEYIESTIALWPSLTVAKQDLIALANAQKPKSAMIELVRELKDRGYTLHILSNIGTPILENLVHSFPELFTLFDHCFTTNSMLGYATKREKRLFEFYLASCGQKTDKHYILIDDSHKNLETGSSCGIFGIYGAHAQTVRSVLERLGIYNSF